MPYGVLRLWFAWKFVPLWYQQQLLAGLSTLAESCDLLENSYLCGISNNHQSYLDRNALVVICLKIRTFVVSATTQIPYLHSCPSLWFAWKFVPLWYQQQHYLVYTSHTDGCDLLENSYLCGISNNPFDKIYDTTQLWFAWKFVPLWYQQQPLWWSYATSRGCDLLENSYLCGISNN